ncbi:DUF3237 domain-containing protein [Arthrobacter sp. USHLN218]|uniref:DUF3237 domain-containing protein n=1 Tax=Arthrobacter sp. USHLN218 TaxID=3081232 RepID=UPI003016CE7D
MELELAFTLYVDLDAPVEVGATPQGTRRIIPITGGRFEGPLLKGDILPGGADWNLVRPDGIVHLWARYTIRADDGALIMVTNEGWGTQDDATMQQIFSGVPMDPAGWYCRTQPRFEADMGRHQWLNESVFAGDLRPPTRADQVVVDIYRIP